MGNLGIRAKIRSAILVLGAGYIVLLLVVQWIGSATESHMKIASGSLFPAALSSQEADAAFQKLTKRYSDAVLLQDKGALSQAEEAGQAVIASLESVEQHTQFNPERQKEVAALKNQVRDLISRSTSLYSTMLESKELSQQTQVAAGAVARDDKEVEAALIELQKKLSNDFQQQLKAVTELSQRQRFLALTTFILAGLCAAGLAVMVERQVSVPLRNLTMRLKDIAEGEGDLTKRLEIATTTN